MAATAHIVIEARCQQLVKRFQVPRHTSWETAKKQLQYHFSRLVSTVKYRDEEGDLVSIDKPEEFSEALRSAEKTGVLVIVISDDQGNPSSRPTGHGGHYAELAHVMGSERERERKEGGEGRKEAGGPCWFNDGMEKQTLHLEAVLHAGLEGMVDLLTSKDSPVAPSAPPPVHNGILCDHCEQTIAGVRYKCGNCPDYDLCDGCEPLADTFHPQDHVFLKIKVPARYAGLNKKGKLKPLLRKNVYCTLCDHVSSSEEEEAVALTTGEQRPAPQRPMPPQRRRAPEGEMVVRSKEAVRRDLEAAKQRRREEKRTRKEVRTTAKKERAGAAMSGSRRDAIAVCPEASSGVVARGHGKYLDAKFVADTCYPDGSILPYGMPFSKGWVIANSGTKRWKHVVLVHQDGMKPPKSEVSLPEIKPGERTEVVVSYSALSKEGPDHIKSSWRLIHKGSTPFGPALWLSIQVDKEPLCLPSAPPPPSHPPSLTNTNLLQSIGFIPSRSDSVRSDEVEGEGEGDLAASSFVPVPPEPFPEGVTGGEGEVETESISSEALLQTFELISLDMPAGSQPPGDAPDDAGNAEAPAEDDIDDFVVVIPDCFNLDVPLPGYVPPTPATSATPPAPSAMPMLVSIDSHVTASLQSLPPTGKPDEISSPPPTFDAAEGDASSSPSKASPSLARKEFVPERVTLKGAMDARMRNPFSYAIGFVNTVSNLMDDHLHFVPSNPVVDEGEKEEEKEEEEEEEVVPLPSSEVTPPPPSSELVPEDTSLVSEVTPAQATDPTCPAPPSRQSSQGGEPWVRRPADAQQVSLWLRTDEDISRFVNREGCPPPLPWQGPPSPATPMEKLVKMGFANRSLNARLLQKHGQNLQPVINELLDGQDNGWATVTI